MALKIAEGFMQAFAADIKASNDPNSPFYTEGADVFLRHDEMRIRAAGVGMLAVEFYWRGWLTYTMTVSCDLMAGQLATITGVEGRMRTSICNP